MALTNDKPAVKKILCDNCVNDNAAQSRCNECGMFLCQFCTEFHKQSRSTTLHKLLTMEELKSNTGLQNIAEKIKCPKHKEEVVKLFCKTCQTTICRDCTIVDHQSHKYAFVEDVAVEEKQHLQSNLDEVKQRKVKVVQGIVNLKKFDESLEAKKKSTISEINEHFDDLIRTVESRKNEMVEKATSLTNSKQKQIHGQLEVLEVALASCESSIEFTEQAFKNGNDVQILSMEKYILQSLEQLKTVNDHTEPCVTADMTFIFPSSVQETNMMFMKEYDVDVAVASPGNCNASFKENETSLKPGSQYSITLICNDKNNQRLRYGGQVIKSSFTGMEVSDVVVTDNNDGSYVISFCPRQGGMLKFEVSVNGMPAPNCSLTKKVKWVISDVHGKGVISDDGLTMKGEGRYGDYCYRVGGCYFESGVHTWKVRVNNISPFGNLFPFAHVGSAVPSSAEVGVIDYDEIKSEKKWVHRHSIKPLGFDIIYVTLDMEKKTLNITSNDDTAWKNYQFTARRVSPFFACLSPFTSLTIVQ